MCWGKIREKKIMTKAAFFTRSDFHKLSSIPSLGHDVKISSMRIQLDSGWTCLHMHITWQNLKLHYTSFVKTIYSLDLLFRKKRRRNKEKIRSTFHADSLTMKTPCKFLELKYEEWKGEKSGRHSIQGLQPGLKIKEYFPKKTENYWRISRWLEV